MHPTDAMAASAARARSPTTESASDYLPARRTLATLRTAAQKCHGCPLWKLGTQTVFGEGSSEARVILVGEQPGDQEDLQGRPFVGPAGRLLDKALVEAGLDRKAAYVTNAVKHFKWTPKGSRRLHKKPGVREVDACLPWLEAEIEVLRPEVLVLLGATAAQAVMGPAFRVTESRGQVLESRFSRSTIATVHPSSLLRLPPQQNRDEELARFVADLAVAARLLVRSRRSR